MRYKIIDTHDSNGNEVTDSFGITIGSLLSDKETVSKFKEIWQDGYNSGYDELSYPPKNELKDWQELKETL